MPTLRAGKHGVQHMCAIGPTPRANLTLVLLDEPSMGLAPQIVKEVLHLVKNLHTSENLPFWGPSKTPIWRSNAPTTATSGKAAAWS